MLFMRKTTALPSAAEALPGRATPILTAVTHFVNGRKLQPPYPAGFDQAVFALGCFWGAERKFWELGEGIFATAVGYAGAYVCDRTTVLATIPIGYADGFFRRLSSSAEVLIRGGRARVVGNVSMDMASVDVTEIAADRGGGRGRGHGGFLVALA